MFQSSGIFRVKELVRDTICIMVSMLTSLLRAGPAAPIRGWIGEVCERVGKGHGFVMLPATNEMEDCDPALIPAWVDATTECGVYADPTG